ncbi:helix-turn-helix transcriptional regulator [Neobittarella massiliensis]|uniref:Helix-turn-helix transcriptional regulator n=1 Tax=Neobittarella massiliensis (ex Bilen et al. 2018) TaxID=2041842 RepID=A0A8J6INS5_9FIRM|nr:helix-turn-helix transcriptional regulator [Neobittarella massiliensis]
MEILVEFSRTMKTHRKLLRWTQEKAAFECEISIEHYKRIELGKSNPGLIIAVRIARILDIDLNALKCLENEPN